METIVENELFLMLTLLIKIQQCTVCVVVYFPVPPYNSEVLVCIYSLLAQRVSLLQ